MAEALALLAENNVVFGDLNAKNALCKEGPGRFDGDVMLVDCDALGGGLDLALGAEKMDGLRWSGLALGDGRVPTAARTPTRHHRTTNAARRWKGPA